MINMNQKLMLAAIAAVFAGSAVAATPVYDGTTAGNQGYGQMLGNDFTVTSSGVWVTQVGVFDDGMNGLVNALRVALYNVTLGYTSVIAPVTFASGTANGGTQFIFQNVTPVQLTNGHTYSVQSIGFSSSDKNFNTNIIPNNNPPDANVTSPITFNTFGGLLQNEESRYGGVLGQAGTYFPHSSTLGAGTVAVVPEPGSMALTLAGLSVMGAVARRRKSNA